MTERWALEAAQNGKTTHIYRDVAPWWVFAIGDFFTWFCDHIPQWHVPPLRHLPITRDGERYTWGQYHGTIDSVFCVHIHAPIMRWCSRRTGTRAFAVDKAALEEPHGSQVTEK